MNKAIWEQIFVLYFRLGGMVLLGWMFGHLLPKYIPLYLGKFLFWLGVPISIFAFLRQANLSSSIWLAPVFAWVAMLVGMGLAWLWIKRQRNQQINWSQAKQGSFLLAAMVGNTGYLGYPVTLALVGTQYFGWALFYDLLGSTLGTYGLGVILAARYGGGGNNYKELFAALIKNPALFSFFLGLGFRTYPLPLLVEQGLQFIAWGVVALALLLIGMRLSGLTSWGNVQIAAIPLVLKMLLVPLLLSFCLWLLGLRGSPLLVVVLQMGMPPAFATLILAEAYNLDRDLAVTTLAMGSFLLLFTLPVWLVLFNI